MDLAAICTYWWPDVFWFSVDV